MDLGLVKVQILRQVSHDFFHTLQIVALESTKMGMTGICTNFWLTPPSLLRTGFGSTTNNTGFGSTTNTGGSLFGGTSGGFGSTGGTSRLVQRSGTF